MSRRPLLLALMIPATCFAPGTSLDATAPAMPPQLHGPARAMPPA